MPADSWLNDLPDEQVFNQIPHNNEAFQVIFKKYFAVLCAYCQFKYSFDLDLAKEAVHGSFIKLWENRTALSAERSVKAYLYSIINNSCLDIIRHQNVKRKHESNIRRMVSESETEAYFQREDLREIQAIIDTTLAGMPEKMREVFELSRMEGLKYSQISKKLNISVKTVETQIGRALARLRTKLKKFNFLLAGIFFYFFY